MGTSTTGTDGEADHADHDTAGGQESDRPGVPAQYRTLVETVGDGAYSVDPNGRFATVDEAFAAIHGRSREELVGSPVSELLSEHVVDRIEEIEREIVAGDRKIGKLEAEIERPDGDLVTVETRFSLVETRAGEHVRIGLVRDVTDRTRREHELKRRVCRQRVVTELGQLALEADDVDGLFATVVERVAETLDVDSCTLLEVDPAGDALRVRAGSGWPKGEVGEETVAIERDSLTGRTLLAGEPVVVTGFDEDERFDAPPLPLDHGVASGMSAVVGGVEKPWGVLVAHDGRRREFSAPDVNFLQSVATTLATAIRRAVHERELKKYETIVESVSDGVYTIDGDYRFSMVNGAYAELAGYDRAELVGASPTILVDDDVVERATAIERELFSGDLDSALLEAELRTSEGELVPVEAMFSTLSIDGDRLKRIGVVRDVSERKRFEETLQGLYETSRDLFRTGTIEEVSERIADVAVDVLGLPGVAVYLYDEERDRLYPVTRSAGDLFVRDELPSVPADEENVVGRAYERGIVERVEDVRDTPVFGHDVDESRAAVFAPLGDHGVVVAEARDVESFDVRTTKLVELLAANAEVAYDRAVRERAIERQRERSAALNDLNGVVRDIYVALIDRQSREGIERAVVERLAGSDSYEFAWIGDVDQRRDEVVLRAEAGVEGYLEDLTISISPGGSEFGGPTAQAILTGEMQVFDDIPEDAEPSVWRDRAEAYGFLSTAAIPIAFEGTQYGVLDVYADRRNAFEGEEGAVVGQLGGIIGHAINAIERKQALVSDAVVELEFMVHDVFEKYGVEGFSSGRIVFHRTVPVGEDEYVVYGTASDGTVDTMDAFCERFPYWTSLSFTGEPGDGGRFELTVKEPPTINTVVEQGGRVHRAEFRNGTFNFVVHLPPSADVRSVVEAVQGTHPNAHVIAQRRRSRPVEALSSIGELFEQRLTEKQRRALEAAYFSGFYAWPRASTGEEVAETLGVSAPTFHEHLRVGERELLASVFGTPPETG